MRSPISVLPILLGLAGCSQLLGLEDLSGPSGANPDGPPGDTMNGPAAECVAQRAVYLVGGQAGHAWFTLAWPAPSVITAYQAAYAYDDPAKAKDLTTDPAHPLLARKVGNNAIWEGIGRDPYPSVFVAGVNETHTQMPSSIAANGALGMVAAGAAIQDAMLPRPPYALLVFSPGGFIGSAPMAPAAVTVADVDGAVGIFNGVVTPTVQQQLRPSAAQMSSYIPPGASLAESNFGSRLAYTANAFRLGLLSSVVIQAFSDDPHGTFDIGTAGQRADSLARALDAFYRDLSTANEQACGVGGRFLSVADNTVLVALGDTPKNSFVKAGWPDGTPGNSNWVYVRSNGFTKPGWFGQVTANGRVNFNPNTGALDAMATNAASTGAAFAATLYAIARGRKPAVQALTNLPFDGAILR